MGKRDDNIHMKRYCNVYVYVYVYLCTSVYIGLCLCVHICILIAGCFTICICEIGLFLFSKAITNTKYCLHTVHKNTVQNNRGPMQLQLPGPSYTTLADLKGRWCHWLSSYCSLWFHWSLNHWSSSLTSYLCWSSSLTSCSGTSSLVDRGGV